MKNLLRKALAIAVASLIVAVSAMVSLGTPSGATALTGAITNVTVSAPHDPLQNGDAITTNVSWMVPNGTKAGDTFTLTLPPQLTGFPSGSFPLNDPSGQTVANAVISNGVVTFTMTQYAETHTNVSGTATFSAYLDSSQVTSGEDVDLKYVTNDLQHFDGHVTAPVVTNGNADTTNPSKFGQFTDAAQTDIQWEVKTQVGAGPFTVTDDLSSTGTTIVCSNVQVLIGTPTGSNDTFQETGNYTSQAQITCNASADTLKVVTGTLQPNQMIDVVFHSTVPAGSTQTEFDNTATVASPTGTKTATSNTLTRTSASGNGNGTATPPPTPAISITKGDSAGNAADTAATAVTLPNGSTGIVITVKNTGQDALEDITVSDALDTTNGSVSGLSCDFSKLGGPASGVTWNGPLAVGASFTCTASLTGVTAGSTLHEDTATVKATGVLSGKPVTDSNPYYATAPGSVSVGDYVWLDANRNGLQDAGEAGIAGVTLTLTGPDGKAVTDVHGNTVAPTVTDSTGHYTFVGLPILPAAEHYTVTIDSTSPALANLLPTQANVGADRSVDSSTGSATSTDLTQDGQRDATLDFGFVTTPYAIGDYVWNDVNQNGIQDSGEQPIPDVIVTLQNAAGQPVNDVTGIPVPPAKTDSNGFYHFDNLPAGDYQVVFSAPPGMSFTTQAAGSDRTVDSNASATGVSDIVHLGPSDANLTDSTRSDDVTAPKIDRTIDAGLFASPSSPSIRVEKYDGVNSFTPDPNVTTANKDSNSPKGDADTLSTAIVSDATATTPVSITLNNNGSVWLYDVTVVDQTVSGTGTVSGLSCTWPDGSKGLYFAGPLTVGAVVKCTGTLPALGANGNHEDQVTVYARPGIITAGQQGPNPANKPTGQPIKPGDAGTISDNDLFFVTTPVTPAPTTTTAPVAVKDATATNTAATPSSSSGPLAFTGLDLMPLLGIAGALISAGLLLARRRRREW